MLLDGRAVAQTLKESLREKIKKLSTPLGLTFILVGENSASLTYVRMKQKACQEVGIASQVVHLPYHTDLKTLLGHIEALNRDPTVHALLVQMPLPSHLSLAEVIYKIHPDKDVDGFHPSNLGKLVMGEETLVPCTPLGILTLLKHYSIPTRGKNVVILGRSLIVGKPLALLFSQKGIDATVTLCHSYSESLPHLQKADIVVAAMGSPHFLKAHMIQKGAVVIDVGTNRHQEKLVGDVDFEEVKNIASAITPSPGGVGPMTIATLLSNTLQCYQKLYATAHPSH